MRFHAHIIADCAKTSRRRYNGKEETGMHFEKITEDKKRYLPLLLLADEQENMIDRYLERGTLYVLNDDGVKAVCVVTDEGNGVLEIKNLAVDALSRNRGYGKKFIDFIAKTYAASFSILRVGTGDSPLTLPFYEKCDFRKAYIVQNFFTDNYEHPIIEAGIRLTDMIYLEKIL